MINNGTTENDNKIFTEQEDVVARISGVEKNIGAFQSIDYCEIEADTGKTYDNIIDGSIKPIIKKSRESIDDTCFKAASFLLRYANCINEKDSKMTHFFIKNIKHQ